jgi:hypothetical protein
VGRGGVLKHARSNITMQRSAFRSRLMTALRRSRPLMVALDPWLDTLECALEYADLFSSWLCR